MNRQHAHNALTQTLKTQKNFRCVFLVVKTEETFSSQGQKLVETTNL